MSPQDVAKLLTAIAAVDDRLDPDEARVTAWANILDSDMTYEFAIGLVKKHYGNSTKVMMPADLNLPWRNFRDQQRNIAEIEMAHDRKREISPETRKLIESLRGNLMRSVDDAISQESAESAETGA